MNRTMTDTEINEAIAKACGWHFEQQAKIWWAPAGTQQRSLLNYCEDLNAMRDARSTLNEVERTSYSMRLSAALGEPNTLWPLLDASARQQAEAFLKVKGLWRE